MRRILLIPAALCFLILAAPACKQEEILQAANTVADAPKTGFSLVDAGIGVAGLILTIAGARTTKAVYGAVQYPKTPYTEAEMKEMASGLAALGVVTLPADFAARTLPKPEAPKA